MWESVGRRVAVIAVVVLAAANVVFWGYLYHRQSAAPATYAALSVRPDPHASSPAGPPAPIPATDPATSAATPASPGPSSTPSGAASPGPAHAVTLPAPGSPVAVTVIGDALATGRYASGPSRRYRSLVLAALAARGPVVIREAPHDPASSLSMSVSVPSHVDLVILEVGTDDLLRTSAADFRRRYTALVQQVRAASPAAALLCAGTWSRPGSGAGSAFDAAVASACGTAGGRFVALQRLYADPADRGPAGVAGYYGVSDGVAPNDAGHRAIAAALLAPLGLAPR